MDEAANQVQHLADMFIDEDSDFQIERMGNPYGFHLKEEAVNTVPSAERKQVAECLGRAMRHAERVCKREHIKADRIQRVNQFIVSLRSQILTYGESRVSEPKALVNALCKKEVWYDIGQPIATGRSSGIIHGGSSIASSEITGLVSLARTFSHNTDAQAEEILGDLEEVERGIGGLRSHIEQAERINEEGEGLLQELCAVFSDD